MIILRNYLELGTYIVIKSKSHTIEKEENINEPRHGVGGILEDGLLIGCYLNNDNLYFQINSETYEIKSPNFKCTNEYISKLERCFSVTIGDEKICEIVYEPYIDPGMLYYDADPEEFDVLLYMSGVLKDKESMQNFIRGMKKIKEEFSRNKI